ncbi:MAG TPA: hypothetical protein VL282_19560 [Tepidisphaeraceae bacterium]|jgi:hypothetical protein|nr:hypothetical protein [Tepidisphaeraceae bacterium]
MTCFVLLASVLAACATKPSNTAQAQAAPNGKTNGRVIVKLVSRENTIVARAGANGPTYSLERKNGEVLVAPQTLSELRVNRPAMANEVQTLQAGAWAGM